MLTISKKEIYEFAYSYDIYYLNDSTPKWSQRGKIRDIVRPTLENWSDKIVGAMFDVSDILKDTLGLVDILINKYTENRVDGKVIIEFKKDEIQLSNIFWRKLFEKINLHFTSKSLGCFLDRLKGIHKQFINLEINVMKKYQLNARNQIEFMKTKLNTLIIRI
jgi:tRNA(Ile)-lysidine synthase TilS/MesJ